MLKTLIKKQLMEYFRGYFVNMKNGKKRSLLSVIGLFLLFILLLGTIGFAVGALCYSIAGPLIMLGFDSLYFTIGLLLSVCLGVFGSVFNTYAGLYHAKDNEMLLSMPIPPSKLLISRLISVYVMGLIYQSIVIIPVTIVYYIYAEANLLRILSSVLLMLISAFLVLAITCLLGWIVALISTKIKNKSFVSVIATLLFIVVYYAVYFKMGDFITLIVQNTEKSDAIFRNWLFPLYLGGQAFSGETVPYLIFTLICVLSALLTFYIMSKSFVKITTVSSVSESSNKKYTKDNFKSSSIIKTLIKKEFLHFKSCPTYMLNCGLGVIVCPLAAIVLLVKKASIMDTLLPIIEENAILADFIPVVVALLGFVVASMDGYTAPSISLEGKNLWILQALPVDSKEVFRSKQIVHIVLNAPPTVIFSSIFCYVFELDFSVSVLTVVFSLIAVMFVSAFGLMLNLLMPNLNWTNETVPIKQSMPPIITIFGNWIIAGLFGVAYYFLCDKISPDKFIVIILVIMLFATRFINRFINTKGIKIFADLH